jgi:hypothetical protein
MRFDAPRLLACAVAAGLGTSPLAAAPATYLEMSICGMREALRIPIPGKPSPRPDCPTGCHALASRKCEEHEDCD